MRAARRAALLAAPALFGLASCGIPPTGVVEAGAPARGVVPTVRVYLVVDGRLVPVPRRIVAPVDAETAVNALLQGPTAQERALGFDSALPGLAAARTSTPPEATAVPAEPDSAPAPADDSAEVTTRGGRVSIRLPFGSAGKLPGLAVAQLICTAVEAQRIADPGGGELTATLTGQDGDHVQLTPPRCPTV
ncbi:hypothetical protein KEF29_06605 [Streptomyces tuirus]|uniref:GerMN domain-containing protein n=1 Tax=Streptomyces tuirus TaxID=68278 RepID=A0A941FEV8_9ACTN|nr:hypothetical protein [Streptomyces tuirus]